MTTEPEKAPPKPPRGMRAAIKHTWFKLVEDLEAQGIDPHSRVREMEMFIRLVAEESDLDMEWSDASLDEKLAIGRRFDAISAQKLKVLELVFAPAFKQAKARAS